MEKTGRCYVLDATALIQGLAPTALDEDAFTVPEVIEEVRPNKVSSMRIDVAISSGRLKTKKPSSRSIAIVSDIVKALGEDSALSKTDQDLLALALDLRESCREVTIISDDYAIQNVSAKIGIPFVKVAASGITLAFTWSLFCPACRRTYPSNTKPTCPVCGTPLKRMIVKKHRV
ncbi:MAG: NOB1 family endonuclease [Thermoproteota archaeon]